MTALLTEMIVGIPPVSFVPLYIGLGLPATIDGTTQLLTERESTNLIRVLTGFIGGFGLMLLLQTVRVLI